MRVLIAGWFSFADGLATAGDLQACDLVAQWLAGAGYAYDVALAPPGGGVDWRSADPTAYSHVIFVCGPFGQWPDEIRFLARFSDCRLIGINLSMLVALDEWNRFDLLFERDSSARARPDLAFGLSQARTPIVGVCLVESYGYEPGPVDAANAAMARLIAVREMAVVAIDTRLDTNSVGLCTASGIEALLGRMDVVVTTRLHGMVFALKNGVPAVAIDPQAGGGKIRRQAETIGWPTVVTVDALTDEALLRAFEYCLTPAAQAQARDCAVRARRAVQEIHEHLVAALAQGVQRGPNRTSLDSVRTMAANLGVSVPRPVDPSTTPGFASAVFRRSRRIEAPLGASPKRVTAR